VPQAPRGLMRRGEGVSISPLEEGSGEGLCPSPENFSYFLLLKIPYFDAFWHVYFLSRMPMGGVLTP